MRVEYIFCGIKTERRIGVAVNLQRVLTEVIPTKKLFD